MVCLTNIRKNTAHSLFNATQKPINSFYLNNVDCLRVFLCSDFSE